MFVPAVKAPGTPAPWWQANPVYRVGHILFQQVLGWPLYLLFNVSGHEYPRWVLSGGSSVLYLSQHMCLTWSGEYPHLVTWWWVRKGRPEWR